jgi:hypothetical protein
MPHPTLGSKPNLATPDDIVARLGRNLNQMEALRVDAMLSDGSAIIRRYARNDFLYTASDVMIFVADAGVIVLPGKPIYSVDQVSWISGYPNFPNWPVFWFVFDGVDRITIPGPRSSGIINLPYYMYSVGWYSDSFEVTYSHGYSEVPSDIKGMLCSAIISELATPTQSATIQSEVIGAYSYSMRRRDAGGGIYASLVDFGMTALLADYRKKNGTVAVRT